MSQFMVKGYSGGDKPETDYFSCRCLRRVGRCDRRPAAVRSLIRGAKPGDLRCPYPLTKIGFIRATRTFGAIGEHESPSFAGQIWPVIKGRQWWLQEAVR